MTILVGSHSDRSFWSHSTWVGGSVFSAGSIKGVEATIDVRDVVDEAIRAFMNSLGSSQVLG